MSGTVRAANGAPTFDNPIQASRGATNLNDLLGRNDVIIKKLSCTRFAGGLVLTGTGLGAAGYGVSLILPEIFAGASISALPIVLIVAGVVTALVGLYFLCTSRKTVKEFDPQKAEADAQQLRRAAEVKRQQQKAAEAEKAAQLETEKKAAADAEKATRKEAEKKARKAEKAAAEAARKAAEEKAAAEKLAAREAKKARKEAEKAAKLESERKAAAEANPKNDSVKPAEPPPAPTPPVLPQTQSKAKSGEKDRDAAGPHQKGVASQDNVSSQHDPRKDLTNLTNNFGDKLKAIWDEDEVSQRKEAEQKEGEEKAAKEKSKGPDKKPPQGSVTSQKTTLPEKTPAKDPKEAPKEAPKKRSQLEELLQKRQDIIADPTKAAPDPRASRPEIESGQKRDLVNQEGGYFKNRLPGLVEGLVKDKEKD